MADGLLNKASIILTPTGYKAGTLYNVAPVVEPYEDFDFARASVASRVNSSGLVEMVGRTLSSELVTNGDFATDSDWSKGTGWSIQDNKAIYSGTANANLSQSGILTSSKQYKLEYEVISSTLVGGIVKLSGQTASAQNVLSQSVGTHTLYFTANGTSPTDFNIRVVINTAGQYEITNVSVKEVIDTNNIPRISYDSNGDNGHILLEPTSTNLITYSEDFSEWTLGNNSTLTYESDVVAPDGSLGVYRLQNPQSGSTFLTIGVINCRNFSLFVKAVTAGVNNQFNLDASGQPTDTKTATTQWQRYDRDFGSQANYNLSINNGIDNYASDIYIWGAQAEALSYATSYIPTLTGSQEVRETETATGAGSADLINSTEGVLYAEIAGLVDDLSFRTISISDGTTSNRCVLRYGGTTNYINVLIFSGGSTVFDNNYTLSDITDFSKIAVKWKVNDFALWVDGVERKTDTSGSAPIGLSQLQLSNYDNSSNNFYGKCKALAVFNEALSDSELTQLTT
jgi:hypothetical protein